MYYKVIHNQKTIDLISGKLQYVKYQLKHKVLLLCEEKDAQGVLADSGKCYHLVTCLPFPCDEFPTVTIEEISEHEYEQLSRLCLKTPEEIAEEIILELMGRGVL